MALDAVAARPAKRRALVVEDDPAIRKLVQKLLARQGMEVDLAADGLIARSLLESGSYSVVILDLMVPGLNGFELIEVIRQGGSRTPVAVVSAVSQQSLTSLDLDVVKIVVSKPFDVDEFTRAVVGLCEE
jgi:two-component system OmpR family response regulator